ncbi:MAG: phosphatase PAP2 family protein [Bacteroidota bacterium]
MHELPGHILSVSFIESLKNSDRWLFRKINQDWTAHFFDVAFPLWREAITWMPLYIFLLLLVLFNFGIKVWPWIIGFIVTVSLTDQVSSHVFKTLVQRPRPCLDPYLVDNIRLLLEYCSSSFSFTSSHATNHFGMAVFVHFTMRKYFGKWTSIFFFWALTISYGQVYIGIHYPLDVICGALLGTAIGFLTAYIFNTRFGLPPLRSTQKPIVKL